MTARTLWLTCLFIPLMSGCIGDTVGDFPHQEELCDFDSTRELARAASAVSFPQPVVDTLLINGALAWSATLPGAAPTLSPGDVVTLNGTGLGNGPDVDFTKLMIGNSRVLETDLKMYKQKLDLNAQVNFEIPETHSTWDKDVISWTNTQVVFRVPVHVSGGPLKLQVQKRIGYNESLLRPGQAHNIIDAQTKRITDDSFIHTCDVVSVLSDEVKAITPINVTVSNPDFDNLVAQGRAIFWAYDYNIGLAHKVRNLDWTKIFNYQTTDPITRLPADPALLFGAHPTVAGEVPPEAINDVYFDPYPQPNPIPGWLTIEPQFMKGNTRDSGWVGYRYAQSSHPYTGRGEWIGFNCASCHGYRITYEQAPGQAVTKVFPGLPNPEWTMKWTILGDKNEATTATFDGIVRAEPGPPSDPDSKNIDRTTLVYYMPAGTGEHNLIRGSDEGSETDNDYQFSPIAIPNVSYYMPIRRSLSHTESYVGFEGSYIHSEEPDGAMGSMGAPSLKALTAYMTVLDQDDDDLRNAGLYRWLQSTGRLAAQTGNPGLSEGAFVQAGWQSFPGVVSAVNTGKTAFDRDCGSCHTDALGSHTNEKMFRLDEVGRFFAPTIYQKDQQSIRVNFLRDVYWTQSRGLLSDGHVRNVEDLVHPDRCTEGTALYNQYYTLHAPVRPAPGTPDQPTPWPDVNRKGDVFRIYKNVEYSSNDPSTQRNRFIERHKYFVEVAWDDEHYYWDYQKMRAEYGPDEMGTDGPIGLPAAPHPWCAASAGDVMDLTQYVLTL
ncbi:hypothetical protein S7S_11120 [Isoalcanivorax pacificus W11-5]|uniref:Cytochrome c domain-containing protein n=1 Tax=Isoalcanivorax pacificus W11-5 TaxID=391936 RepID=A0A0B4XNH0_9GAMM|nr:hypothetical protein [Isoalcanivorax pacificus]AJD48636.1 hypothetical protein S7S_11120 [Isoalcanivorax pacificus W11-5]